MTAPGYVIEDLFNAGHPLDHVVESGLQPFGGWTRDDVMAVLRERGWDLDASGRLPRSKRVTTPRGLRSLPPPRMPEAAVTPAPVPARFTEPLPEEEPTDEEADEPRPKTRGGRKPLPIEHGTDRGYDQHKKKKEPIPADDACGCQAAHDATLTRPRRPRPVDVVPDADEPTTAPAPAPPPTTPTAEEIRARVDEMAPRVHPDGSINARFVAIEQTLRTRHGHPSYIPELDGLGKFRPHPEPQPEPPLQAARELEPTVTTRHPGRDLDEWLAGAQRSTSPTVRKHAHIAIAAALQLIAALDALARAERAYARSTR